MGFKLGDETREIKTAENTSIKVKNPAVYSVHQKNLGGGTLGRANMDGSIDVDLSINLKSKFGKKLIKHELCHVDQIQSGRAAYGDGWVMWEGKIYFRKNENGTPVVDGPNGRWPEGHPNHPWEAEAIEAETN